MNRRSFSPPKPAFLRRIAYWRNDLRRPKRAVRIERAVLRTLRAQRKWGDGYLAMPISTIERATGIPKNDVTRALRILVGRRLVRPYTFQGRTVYLPEGRSPSAVVSPNDGRVRVTS